MYSKLSQNLQIPYFHVRTNKSGLTILQITGLDKTEQIYQIKSNRKNYRHKK